MALLIQKILNTIPLSPTPSSLRQRYVDLTVYPSQNSHLVLLEKLVPLFVSPIQIDSFSRQNSKPTFRCSIPRMLPPHKLLTDSRKTTSGKPSQNPTPHPIIFPKQNFLPITHLPDYGFFEIPAPTLQAPDLPQIFPPKRVFVVFPSLPQTSPPPYLESIISFHKSPLSDPKRHTHLPSNAKLKVLKSIILRPLSSRAAHTFFQEAQITFLPLEPHPHRKFL